MGDLLDTHVFIRVLVGSPLPRPVERALEKAGSECYVSIVSAWEIVMKPQLRLTMSDVEVGIAALGAQVLPIRFSHLAALSELPMFEHHRDPFDRLLIAQAISEGLRMVSSDARFPDYKKLRLLWD
jgi:PIN domain nuclease of toxin-antitoxin system